MNVKSEMSIEQRCNATHCSALQGTATHCNALQRTATHYNALQRTATHCNTQTLFVSLAVSCLQVQYLPRLATRHVFLQHAPATHFNTYCNALLCCTAAPRCWFLRRHYNAQQSAATHCNALQRTAMHCNALQCIATHCSTL